MRLLDSLNDGKTMPKPPSKEKVQVEPFPDDKSDESGDKETEEEVKDKTIEEGDKVSNIHMAAKVGHVQLLLHSKNEHLAVVEVKGTYDKMTVILLLTKLLYRSLY